MEALSGREGVAQRDADGLIVNTAAHRPPYKRLVPLQEIIAKSLERGVETKGVQALYERVVQELGPELAILQAAPVEAIAAVAGERVADGVGRVRRGDLVIQPGYDGVYGTVSIWP